MNQLSEKGQWMMKMSKIKDMASWLGFHPYKRTITIRNTEPKIGRNEKCPCGSDKKYKKCCLNRVSNEQAVY